MKDKRSFTRMNCSHKLPYESNNLVVITDIRGGNIILKSRQNISFYNKCFKSFFN